MENFSSPPVIPQPPVITPPPPQRPRKSYGWMIVAIAAIVAPAAIGITALVTHGSTSSSATTTTKVKASTTTPVAPTTTVVPTTTGPVTTTAVPAPTTTVMVDKITALPDYRSAVSFSNIEVDLNDPDLGPLRESVRRWGAFAAHGEQFTHHAQFVQMVISRYARLVESIEALSLRFDPLSAENAATLQDTDAGGASFAGMPIGIRFSRPIPDLPAFCEELFSSRAPFRLWGQPAITEDEALVEAVDLPPFEVGRIPLFKGLGLARRHVADHRREADRDVRLWWRWQVSLHGTRLLPPFDGRRIGRALPCRHAFPP